MQPALLEVPAQNNPAAAPVAAAGSCRHKLLLLLSCWFGRRQPGCSAKHGSVWQLQSCLQPEHSC
jgi:hypothetical protein